MRFSFVSSWNGYPRYESIDFCYGFDNINNDNNKIIMVILLLLPIILMIHDNNCFIISASMVS